MSVMRSDHRRRQLQRARAEFTPHPLDVDRPDIERSVSRLDHTHLTYQTPPTSSLRERFSFNGHTAKASTAERNLRPAAAHYDTQNVGPSTRGGD